MQISARHRHGNRQRAEQLNRGGDADGQILQCQINDVHSGYRRAETDRQYHFARGTRQGGSDHDSHEKRGNDQT
ncbi:hypothetical protein GCM10023318_30540 [Nocardia callitridis]|uniref:Uncharacterized protein n=1 Tax=Nocardia callitridis TaxID=648753 RepID=A0ABP9KAU6_9NOCA